MQIIPKTITEKNLLVCIQLQVKNTRTVEGSEIVQFYVFDREASAKRPFKELKGFERKNLLTIKTKQVMMNLEKRALPFYNVKANKWTVE